MADPTNAAVIPIVKTAESTKIVANISAAVTAQVSIAAATTPLAVQNANGVYAYTKVQNEMLKQVAIDNARDAVRGTYLARS